MPIAPKQILALVAIAPFCAVSSAPLHAAPAPPKTIADAALSLAGWNYEFDGDQLENAWSWTTQIEPPANGAAWETRVPFHYRDAQNYALLQLNGTGKNLSAAFWRVTNGKATRWGEAPVTLAGANQKGQLTCSAPRGKRGFCGMVALF